MSQHLVFANCIPLVLKFFNQNISSYVSAKNTYLLLSRYCSCCSESAIRVTTTTGPTQPPTLSGTGNEYQPKCGDALRLGSKGRYGSFHLWINVWVAGKTVWSVVNTCRTWAL